MRTLTEVLYSDMKFHLTVILSADGEESFCVGKCHLSVSSQHTRSYLLSPSFQMRLALSSSKIPSSETEKKKSSTPSEREKKEKKLLSGRI